MLSASVQSIGTAVVGIFCMVGVGLLQFPRLQDLIHSKNTTEMAILNRDINSEKLRLQMLKNLPTFGFSNLVSDWTYLTFLQYFGDDNARARTGYSLSPEYFEVILKRDPRFLAAYLSLSTSTSMYAGMPQRSIELMSKGLKSLSPWVPKKSYYVWRYQGVDQLLFLGNYQGAEKSFTNAANWASKHSDPESKEVAAISLGTAMFLNHNPSSKYAQISAWSMVLNNQVDEKTRQRAVQQIEALGGQVITNPDGTARIRFPPKD